MGQAFRRASGRMTPAAPKSVGPDRRPLAGPTPKVEASATQYSDQDALGVGAKDDGSPRVKGANVLEERDPQFDAMLSQMVGRIRAKPGGKLEMGEAAVVEQYKRPMPKLRNTKPDSGRYEDRPAPPGTLNVAQLRHMMLLHQGKADDHEGPMDVGQIAEKFRLEVSQVQRFLEFLTVTPEHGNKNKG